MSLEQWQRSLRRQFGREQNFQLENVGSHPIFSDFLVTNPESKNTYRVRIRGGQTGENFCSCPDFATNTLGTCKHIEFTLGVLERKRGGKSALRAGYQPPYSEVCLHYGAQRLVRFHPGSECPRALARLAANYFDSDGTLRAEAFGQIDQFLAQAARTGHELRCDDDVLAFIAEVRDQDRRAKLVSRAFPAGTRSSAFKGLLKTNLYEYQRQGALFAARAGRCLIGDEMGLGKTVQALAAAEIMARLFGVERVLIICPASLKHQWEREITRFTNRSALVVAGLRPKREQQFAQDSFYKIMNYETVFRDLELIEGWSPDLVILDEAQRIKNWNTRTARSVKRITSPYAIVLTGTPLENRLEELVSIVDFVDRYRLGPTFRFLHEHQIFEPGTTRVVGYRNLDTIGQTLAPILIRRQKQEVLDQLPDRLDKHFFVPMTPQQRRDHEENREIVARIVAKWRKYRFLSEADQRRLTCALQNMRMACDSTYLLNHRTDHGVKADELCTLLEEIRERPEAKVVIFSQWVRMHELLVRRFQKRGWDYVLFHGGVPSPRRKDLIDRFRQEPDCRAFLSTDAGGLGLNLQTASVVVNVDLPWNPAVLEQRIGRVHRLGQHRPVRVVNFVAQGSIEEGILSILRFKKSLFAGVLDGGDKEVFLGGTRLNRFMKSVEEVTSSIPPETPSSPDGDGDGQTEAAEPAAGEPAPARPAASPPAATAPAPAADPWTGLLQTGLSLLEQLAAASRPDGGPAGPATTAATAQPVSTWVERDQQTGKPYLRIPVPPPEVMDQALQAVQSFLERLRQ